jgi:4-hydroxymandelate oxidase
MSSTRLSTSTSVNACAGMGGDAAGSPLFASGTISAYGVEAPSKLPDPMIWALADGELIKSPKDGINVFDFEPVTHRNMPPAHFGYMASGIDDEVTFAREPRGVVEIPAPPAPSQPPANPGRYTA